MQEKIYYDADAVIKELMVLAKNKDYVFRGYGKQTELYPSIIRDTDLRNREIELLIAFEKYGKTSTKNSLSSGMVLIVGKDCQHRMITSKITIGKILGRL